MKWSKVRLVVAFALFAGWVGYLAFLSSRPRQQVVISRPVLAEADFAVKITLGAEPVNDDTELRCEGVLGDDPLSPKVGSMLKIAGIAGVRSADRKPLTAGIWLIPVRRIGGNVVEAVATGSFPSYKSSFGPVAYAATPEVETEILRLMQIRAARTR